MPINKRGFTLIETLFYIGGFLIILAAIVIVLFYMYDWYRSATVAPRVDRVGSLLVDKIVRDIRGASIVNAGQSSFNTSNGVLSITKTVSSVSTTTRFFISNGYAAYQVNGGATSYLSPNGMTITSLYFTSTSTPISSAVRLSIDIAYKTKQGTTTKTFTGFSILRQSYE